MGLDRAFLSMLTASVSWQSFTGEDAFGNDQYAVAVTLKSFVDSMTETFGATDAQGKQDNRRITSGSVITDAKGIEVKDKMTLPSGAVMYVSHVDTGNDESGQPMYQTSTVTSAPRG